MGSLRADHYARGRQGDEGDHLRRQGTLSLRGAEHQPRVGHVGASLRVPSGEPELLWLVPRGRAVLVGREN